MLTTVKIVNYLFSINNLLRKSISKLRKTYKICLKKVCEFRPQSLAKYLKRQKQSYFKWRKKSLWWVKLSCDSRFQSTLVGSNQGNYFEKTIACSKRTLKTCVATQVYFRKQFSPLVEKNCSCILKSKAMLVQISRGTRGWGVRRSVTWTYCCFKLWFWKQKVIFDRVNIINRVWYYLNVT